MRIFTAVLMVVSCSGQHRVDSESLAAADRGLLASFLLPKASKLTGRELALARFGASLFFDPRLSRNGAVSCATCHQPQRAFSDGRATAVALGATPRNTPGLLGVGAGQWFFWDGRADSLTAQALAPFENPAEHGLSRAQLADLVARFYAEPYTDLFGPLPRLTNKRAAVPDTVSVQPTIDPDALRFAIDSMTGEPKKALLTAARAANVPANEFATRSPLIFIPPALAATADAGADAVAVNAARALAAFERTIRAGPAPFDRFVASGTFGPGFGREEWRGYRIFVGDGGCVLCHRGPHFTDGQFHNVGLGPRSGPVDLGRAAGAALVRTGAFNCKRLGGSDANPAVCRELDYLDAASFDAVGAFKTPSLRNVAMTAPYEHDGRFATLEEVLEHYNSYFGLAAVGHREDSIPPLRLSSQDLASLGAFLRSLTGDVTYLRE